MCADRFQLANHNALGIYYNLEGNLCTTTCRAGISLECVPTSTTYMHVLVLCRALQTPATPPLRPIRTAG